MKRHVTALAVLATATAALSLAACGGGGGESAAGGEAAQSKDAQTIRIDANDFAFEPRTLEVSAPGTVTFVVANSGKTEHALEIDGPGVKEATGTIEPGGEAELTVDIAEAGEYEISCPVGGHRDMGMKGTLTARTS